MAKQTKTAKRTPRRVMIRNNHTVAISICNQVIEIGETKRVQHFYDDEVPAGWIDKELIEVIEIK